MSYKAIGIGTIKRCLVNERFVHVADRVRVCPSFVAKLVTGALHRAIPDAVQGFLAQITEPTMSALPPKADIAERRCHVRFVPKADIA